MEAHKLKQKHELKEMQDKQAQQAQEQKQRKQECAFEIEQECGCAFEIEPLSGTGAYTDKENQRMGTTTGGDQVMVRHWFCWRCHFNCH